jgi:hypothetical protein
MRLLAFSNEHPLAGEGTLIGLLVCIAVFVFITMWNSK